MTLTYLFWELCKFPDWQERLYDEMRPLELQERSLRTIDLGNLPILSAVISETLRLHAAIPASLPRVVPAGGRQMGNFFIPSGVCIYSSFLLLTQIYSK